MDRLLELKNVSKHFGGLKAVDRVSFHLTEGEILGLIGPNGAGRPPVSTSSPESTPSRRGR